MLAFAFKTLMNADFYKANSRQIRCGILSNGNLLLLWSTAILLIIFLLSKISILIGWNVR